MNPVYRNTSFYISAYALTELPPDEAYEVAFAGRSNAGKSSALNCLVDQQSLARTSKTPGRTQLINFFSVKDDRYIVDLPGYGYAKVPKKTRQHWEKTLGGFLSERKSLRGVVVVIDSRRGLLEQDRQMIEWCRYYDLPVHLLLTKADKLKHQASVDVLKDALAFIGDEDDLSAQLFSATHKKGIDELHARLDSWLQFKTEAA
ncbi:MAG: YihA family ribosome biogenesis GTP-binding protein [Gammaproteobacteria bacterium]|nr:YihA family ribosome biogenesis GTP-binding protein [Gammaproteobacteria bacterium]